MLDHVGVEVAAQRDGERLVLQVEVFGSDLPPSEVVARIVSDVKAQGDSAVRRYTKLLDGVDLVSVRRERRYARRTG